ncbi:MAG: sigma-70 family RNA polymerase sigma factor [Actinobacteria bacterium]|nr:MAG: sigma-70 family RNA polymerase sigma factor [Actinomycetota bacterium]
MPPLSGTQYAPGSARTAVANGRDDSANAGRASLRPVPGRTYAETADPALKEELVCRFLPLARSLALRYRGASEQLEDLIQVASLGLVKALDGFDLERGRSFIAYAAPTILGELRRHFRDRVWEVRLPRGLQERTMAVNEAAGELSDELGASPTVAQIAARLDLDDEEVSEALQADEARRTLSLDVPRNRQDRESLPMVETVGRTEPGYDAVEAQLAADEASLDERERRVLRLRFEENLNQYEIGRRLGVSQMQVSRIMRRALRKLLRAVQGNGSPRSKAA